MFRLAEAWYPGHNGEYTTAPGSKVRFTGGHAVLFDEASVIWALRQEGVIFTPLAPFIEQTGKWLERCGELRPPKARVAMPEGWILEGSWGIDAPEWTVRREITQTPVNSTETYTCVHGHGNVHEPLPDDMTDEQCEVTQTPADNLPPVEHPEADEIGENTPRPINTTKRPTMSESDRREASRQRLREYNAQRRAAKANAGG